MLIEGMSTSSRRLTASGSRLMRYTLALVSTLARIILINIDVFLLLRYAFFEDLDRKLLAEAILKRLLLVALITLATLAIIILVILVTISTLLATLLGVGEYYTLRLRYTYVRIDS